MEKLNARDICSIIHACHKYKVSRFQLECLKIEFTHPEIVEKEVIRDLYIQQPELPLEQKVLQQKESFNELLEEARLANPRLYEDLVPSEDEEEIDG